ncbi:MAG: SRPBCC domain-containing protein, partial [Candidatus Sericytochromatia bacterium]|nr:SRPBCC domain-containing protein [Candidatus Tanganyikabacteria bacterium]
MDSLHLTADIPASPQAIYDAWLDADEHSAFTGASASVEPQAGGKFSAWDGYIEGT